jgi:hypothetical protein
MSVNLPSEPFVNLSCLLKPCILSSSAKGFKVQSSRFKVQGGCIFNFVLPNSIKASTLLRRAGKSRCQQINPLKTKVQKQIQKQNCLPQVQKLVIAN